MRVCALLQAAVRPLRACCVAGEKAQLGHISGNVFCRCRLAELCPAISAHRKPGQSEFRVKSRKDNGNSNAARAQRHPRCHRNAARFWGHWHCAYFRAARQRGAGPHVPAHVGSGRKFYALAPAPGAGYRLEWRGSRRCASRVHARAAHLYR